MAVLMLIFALEALCTYFPCSPTHGDPKPGIRPRVSGKPGEIALIESGVSDRTIQSRSAGNHLLQQLDFPLVEDNFPTNPIVFTRSGGLRGFRMTTIKGRYVAAFTSIPYAKPPLGNLRFRAPIPIEPWEGIRDALTLLPLCVQLDGIQGYRIRGTEDCLYLNVYTPMESMRRKSGKLLPVMIYIHGGAFVFGNGNYGPAYLLDKDVILVTFNYRVGPLGFLSTGDEACPGNMGLKDQALAMEWVRDNIELFGGNKNQVTLMGQSAGAVSVHLHMMSKRTQGLFHRAIAHSASAFVYWAIRDVSSSLTTKLGKRFNCALHNSTALVDCLRRTPSAFLVSEQFNLWHWWILPGVLFGPVIEQPSADAILTGSPAELYKTGQVAKIPFMSGVVRDEGEVFGFVFSAVLGMRSDLNRRWNSLAPYIFDYEGSVNKKSELLPISKEIRRFYLGDRRVNYNSKELLHNAFGDRYIVTGVHKALQYHTAYGSPTYGYYFNYKGRLGLANSLGYRQDEWGVSHGDDLLYLMNNTNWFHPLELNTPEYTMAEFLINLWTNFATKGRPVFTTEDGKDEEFWPPISDPYNMTFLEINERRRLVPEPFSSRIKFWEQLNVTNYPDPVSLLAQNRLTG